jgi:hypothetical protein
MSSKWDEMSLIDRTTAPKTAETGFNLSDACRVAKAELDAEANAESAVRLASETTIRAMSW